MRKFNVTTEALLRFWKPNGQTNSELDNFPRCGRCTKKYGWSIPIEAYKIVDAGDRRVDVAGRCRGVCHSPKQDELEPRMKAGADNWTDVVRIEWKEYTAQKTEDLLSGKNQESLAFQSDLAKQIAALIFFEPEQDVN